MADGGTHDSILDDTVSSATGASSGASSGGDTWGDSILATYVAIVSMACFCVYWGCRAALGQLIPSGLSGKGSEDGDDDDVGSGWEVEKTETMTAKDALRFPLVGSAVLCSLYAAFKFLPKDLLNNLLTAYFLFFGLFAIAWTLRPLCMLFLGKSARAWLSKNRKKVTLQPAFVFGEEAMQLDPLDVVTLALAIVIGAYYWFTKHWILSNVFGVAFSIQGIALLNLGSYRTGCILLSGLFFYDIWWVFFTDVMVSVAKNFEVPIKLLFPRNIFAETLEFSMLGLGDIVIPGIFVALVLRFDAHNALEAAAAGKPRTRAAEAKKASGASLQGGFATPYFNWTFAGYTAGLVTTIVVMHVFKAAQPALLYLVPSCIGSSFLCAVVRGEVAQLWAYSEEEEEEEEKDGKDGKEKKDE